ncbi:hypothetical protein RFI_23252 [Reticulomyxa filosa]|uniref:tRNAHis guanylyltransferase catalytic domain-containing protein n=1 Tax=Reticulomyxa filosa TaxID=46433 RepID=X6MKD4_RETFI|nr:hypothetical protein RFI_23252 [Reticulomyxa filosa]|eukprot:ETO14116.1 hypothetical protein RFI_23252 [Reticulomyxa filosa]
MSTLSTKDFNEFESRAKKSEEQIALLETQVQTLQNEMTALLKNVPYVPEAKPLSKRPIDIIGARMKHYEEQAYVSRILDNQKPLIVRLDGHCFHTFTKGFDRPFDYRLHNAMENSKDFSCKKKIKKKITQVLATADCLTRFNARSGYTQSDEITLVWDACDPNVEESSHLFGGRVVKTSSVLAGYVSSRFVHHIKQQMSDKKWDENNKDLRAKIENCEAHFDGRAFNVPNKEELCENIVWRSHYDCKRNSISMLAHAHFSPKQLHNKSCSEMKHMLLEMKKIDWETDTPLAFRFGTVVKKELFVKEFMHPISQQLDTTTRTRIAYTPINTSLEMKDKSTLTQFFLDKYWPADFIRKYQDTFVRIELS